VVSLFDRGTLPFWVHRERIMRGWVQAARGDAAGVEHLRRHTKEYLADGNFLLITQDLARLAELHLRLGEIEQGLAVLSEALSLAERTDERHYVAELHRLRGELSRPRSPDEAEAAFKSALDLAARQEARWLELRAAISLARLWNDQGRTQSARSLLESVLEGFTGASRSYEVAEARALLDEWS